MNVTNYITFTPELTKKLRTELEQAIRRGDTQFTFEGSELLVSYAGYMLEYLEDKFKQGGNK